MRRLLVIASAAIGLLSAQLREDALKLAHQAGEQFDQDPATASLLAEQAYQTLSASTDPAIDDLAACAGLTARAARRADRLRRAESWFHTALKLSKGEEALTLRSELGDMLMRAGEIRKAREALGPSPDHPAPSSALAQWFQTLAKVDLACGLPEHALSGIHAALAALPPDEAANRVALMIDEAGIVLRLGQAVTEVIARAQAELRTLTNPHPELSSALVSIAAQAPDLSPLDSLALLQTIDPASLAEGARISFSVTLAEAAARANRPDLVSQFLDPALQKDVLPDDHPLLARALALVATARDDAALAKESSEVALRWLTRRQVSDPEILLGLQRTVDPLSPLVLHAPETLASTALVCQNHALRQRLGGTIDSPAEQTILYLIYQKNFSQHYGALVFRPEPVFVDLGPAELIHRRISDTLGTAERTLAGHPKGATLQVRLTQLYKSVWEPLSDHLDLKKSITIAPTGMLHAVPWAILRQRDGRYLCQEAETVRIMALLGKFTRSAPGSSLLVCGFDKAPRPIKADNQFPFDQRFDDLVHSLPALPGIAKELEAIGGAPLLNPSRAQFLDRLSKKPAVLHLAGHGFVLESEEGHGFRAGLILGGEGQESILFAREIAGMDLSSTELVVLSACRGGIGQNEVGGNWSSLRRAFIAAGVRQVMAAQWQVKDDGLAEFMARFHQKRATLPAHKALWKLQAEWLDKQAPGSEALRAASAGAWLIESAGE